MLQSNNLILCPIDLPSTLKLMKNEFSNHPEMFLDINFLQRIEIILSWTSPANSKSEGEYQSFIFEVAELLNSGLNKIPLNLNDSTIEKMFSIIISVRKNLTDKNSLNKLDEKLSDNLKILLNSVVDDGVSLFRTYLILNFIFDLKIDLKFTKNYLKDQFMKILKTSIYASDSKLSAKIVSNLTKNIFNLNSSEENEKCFVEIFNIFQEIKESQINSEDSSEGREESLAIAVHCLVNLFRKFSLNSNFLNFEILKLIVQIGLTSKQNYVKKISRATLNMIVNLLQLTDDRVWSAYLNFLDTLEQKQIHLIKPALNSLEIFTQGIESKQSSIQKFPCDFSWISIAFRNGFQHLNGYVAKTMVLKYFQSPIPKTSSQISYFLINFALPALNDGDLYQRCFDDNNLQQFFDSLKSYFSELIEIEDNSRILFGYVFQCLESRNWAPAPLFFLMHILSTLPNLKPIWREDILEQLRGSFYSALQGSSPCFRSAIQECAILLALNLTDWNHCSHFKFCSTILPFIPGELIGANSSFFSQSTAMWKETKEKMSFQEILLFQNAETRRASAAAFCIELGIAKFFHSACSSINEFLSGVNCRPYINFNRIDICLDTLVHALTMTNESTMVDDHLVSLNVENIFNYFIIRINQQFKAGDCFIWNGFEDLIRYFIKSKRFAHYALHFQIVLHQKFQTLDKSTEIFAATKLLYPFVVETKTFENVKIFLNRFLSWADTTPDLQDLDKIERQTFVSEFQRIRWKIIACSLSIYDCSSCYANGNNLSAFNFDQLIENIFDLFNTVDDDTSLCLSSCLVSIVSKVQLDYSILIRIMDIVQRVAFEEHNKNETYKRALSDLVSIVLIGFRRTDNDNRILMKPLITKIFDRIFSEAYQNNIVCLCAGKTFYWFSSQYSDACQILMENFENVLLDFATFGHVLRRDQKFSFAASDYLCKLGSTYQCNQRIESDHLAVQKIRAFGFVLIEKYFASNPDCTIMMANFVQLIRQKFNQLAEGKSRSKFHHLSLCHRARTRTLQLLLIIQPFITEKSLANDLIEFCRDLLMAEGHHGSVRIFVEWLVIRLCLAFPALMKIWLNYSDQMGCARIGSLCSWLQIVMHLLLAIFHDKECKSFYRKACNSILPLCTAQNFTVRCCAQAVLKRTWTVYREKFQENIPFQTLLDHCVSFSLEHRNATKHVEKQLADFYFSTFDIFKHYTIENIFCVIPLKCHLPEDETIGPEVFKSCFGSKIQQWTFLPIENKIDDGLKSAPSIIWNAGCKLLEEDEKFIPARFDALQTKSIMDTDDLVLEAPEILNPDRSSNFASSDLDRQLIVMASLLDRPANLGGLCRTCEIFGATEYVISSLKFMEDVQFQNVSVSSERWVNIAEVKPTDLEIFINLKRKQGFSIVGVEQTTTSQDLRAFEFPKKTLLLLGNEKQGIPPYLIQNFLDFCVVIPQTGLIRSLNVHVAGALLIWEYAKQHRLK